MERRNFIKNSFGFVIASGFSNRLLGLNELALYPNPGYLIPTLIDEGIDNLFKNYKKDGALGTSPEIVRDSLTILTKKPSTVQKAYKFHYENSVLPHIGKKSLNGKGINGIDADFYKKMNDVGSRATTPLHTVKEVDDFDLKKWSEYCDLSDKQTADDGRVYIKARDNRDEAYKDLYWVPQSLDYLVYNPIYFCFGLPTQDPVYQPVSESLKRDIKLKTGKVTTSDYFYTQEWLFRGNNACAEPIDTKTTIYWEHDDVIKEFYNLEQIKGCGDPKAVCKGSPSNTPRPDIRN